LTLFKSFVKENRPSLDIDDVATGETWFGEDALAKGLCDEIKTVDDVLNQYVDDGYNIYEVEYDPQQSVGSPLESLLPFGSAKSKSASEGGIIKGMTKWLVKNISAAVREELASEFKSMSATTDSGAQDRYMMKDEAADRIKIEL